MQSNLLEMVQERLDEEVTKLYKGKKGSCSVDGCPNDSYASTLCNAHYIRNRKAMKMDTPIRFSSSEGCMECGKPLNNKGGWNRCSNHYKLARQKAIKKALVDALGGECSCSLSVACSLILVLLFPRMGSVVCVMCCPGVAVRY